MASRAYDGPQKDPGLALVLTILGFFFLAGLQYFYLGKYLKGFLFLITIGFLYIGTIISLFTITSATRQVNRDRALGLR
ncbi:NINE protein [Nesterenkonia populi]